MSDEHDDLLGVPIDTFDEDTDLLGAKKKVIDPDDEFADLDELPADDLLSFGADDDAGF